MTSIRPYMLCVALAAAGCTAGAPVGSSRGESASGKADSAGEPTARHCTGGAIPTDRPTESWIHWKNALITAADPGHSARDVMAARTADAVVRGKFAYGPTSKDLEGERVEVWIDDCEGGARVVGDAITDSDGRIAFSLASGDLPGIGVYDVTLRVVGDGSTTGAELRVFPAGTRVVIFDIDATLTTDDMENIKDIVAELFEPIGAGDYVPTAREDAAAMTRLRQSQGYPIVYLTGRPYWLTGISREWLDGGGFAPGTLMLTQDVEDVLPTDDHVGSYKAEYLRGLARAGFEIEAAYGNASTDIYAYDEVGVPKERTFILGENGGAEGTVDLGEDYAQHLDEAAGEPLPDQPFSW